MTDTALYLVQDSRSLTGDRLMFWAAAGGYTSDVVKAERFTLKQAVKQNQSRETDIPWPLAYLEERTEWSVDHQYVKPDEVAAELLKATKAHLYARGQWNGNDLIFLTGDGQLSDDLRKAEPFPMAIAVGWAAKDRHRVSVIPQALAVLLSRKVVANPNVSIKVALKGTGITLAKPYKSRNRYFPIKCMQCGCFISSFQMYTECPKCDAYNA